MPSGVSSRPELSLCKANSKQDQYMARLSRSQTMLSHCQCGHGRTLID